MSLIGKYPVLTITGPRQSGKTTLVEQLFPEYTYVNFEDIEQKNFALDDPKGFLDSKGKYIETFAKLLKTVFLSTVKNLNYLYFCYVKILHSVQKDKILSFAKVSTYVERDVRQLLNIGDLNSFQNFIFMIPAWQRHYWVFAILNDFRHTS
jgi:hypothetical protein